MADETVEIEIVAKTDMSAIEPLQEFIENYQNTDLDFTVFMDDSDLDSTIDKIEDIKSELEMEGNFTVDDSDLDNIETKKQELEKEPINVKAEVDMSDLDVMETTMSGLAGIGIGAFGVEALQTAGAISDSWNRLYLTFGGVSDSLKQSISSVANSTGRSGAETRAYFNMMGIAGVKNTNVLQASMTALAGKSYQTGEDFNALASKTQKMVLSGKLMNKTIAGMGLSMDMIGQAMGVTGDEASKMFESLSQEERLNVLAKAMGSGAEANEMYKNSFEGVTTKAKAEFSGLMGAIATPLLQGIIPVLTTLKNTVTGIQGVFKSLPQPLQTGISAIFGVVTALGIFAGTMPLILKATGGLGKSIQSIMQFGSKLPVIGSMFTKFSTVIKGAFGNTFFGDMIAKIFRLNTEAGALSGASATAEVELTALEGELATVRAELEAVKIELEAIQMQGSTTPYGAGSMTPLTTSVEEMAVEGAELSTASATAGIEGAELEATAPGLASFSTGLMAMLEPLLMIAGVIAIMLPVIAGIVAEALILIKGIQLLFKALDFGSIDLSGAIKGLKQVGNAVLQVGIIMGEMTFASMMTSIYHLTNIFSAIINPMQVAIDDIKKATSIINQLNNITPINKNIPNKLKMTAESIKAVGTVMGSMADTTWTVMMGNLMTLGGLFGSFTSNLQSASTDITNAINIINSMNLSSIDESKAKQLSTVSQALKNFGDAMSGLGDIQWTDFMNNINPLTDITGALRSAKSDLIEASNVLSEYTGLHEVPSDVGQKISNVANALKNVNNALGSLGDISWTVFTNWINPLSDFSGNLETAKKDLITASTKINELNNSINIPDGVSQKLQRVTWTINGIINGYKSLQNLDGNVHITDLVSIPLSIETARINLMLVSQKLASLNSMPPIPDGLGEKINRVTWTVNTLKTSINAMTGFPTVTLAPATIGLAVGNVLIVAQELNRLASIGVNSAIPSLLGMVIPFGKSQSGKIE